MVACPSRAVEPTATLAMVLAVSGLSRAAMVWPWSVLAPARTNVEGEREGLSRAFGQPGSDQLQKTGLFAALPALLLVLALGLWPAILGLCALIACVYGGIALARHHIGGHTGDVLGASQQVAEMALLLGILIAI